MSSDGDLLNTFQYVLFEGSNDIQINYKQAYSRGAGQASAGIQNEDGTIGLQYEPFDNAQQVNNFSILYTLESAPSEENKPPAADAGPDQNVQEGVTVSLDGSNSSDPDGDTLSYSWSSDDEGGGMFGIGSIEIEDADTVTPYFTAPDLGSDETSRDITVTLEVTDTSGETDADTVVITVTSSDNTPPDAAATSDKSTCESGETVTLDGSGSSDSDGTIASWSWEQISGDTVTLSGSNEATATFTAPDVTEETTLTFELTVYDDGQSWSKDRVSVTVEPGDSGGDDDNGGTGGFNNNPTAEAGTYDTPFESGSVVTLTGSGSTDLDGEVVSWEWEQISNDPMGFLLYEVDLSGDDPSTPEISFETPQVSSDQTLYFELKVTDDDGGTNTDECAVTITPSRYATIYFPLVNGTGFQTDVGLINSSDSDSISGTLEAYDSTGGFVSSYDIDLTPNEKQEYNVAAYFGNDQNTIAYLTFSGDGEGIKGYQRHYVDGQYRAGLPGLFSSEGETLYLPYLTFDDNWYTYVTLLNTGEESRDIELELNTGDTLVTGETLEPGESMSHTTSYIFENVESDTAGIDPADIKSAKIKNAQGLVGSLCYEWGNLMAAVPLSSSLTGRMVFPHVPSDEAWFTGLVVTNPEDAAGVITLIPYSDDGTILSPEAYLVNGKESFIEVMSQTGLPEETAWIEVIATGQMSGLELFSSLENEIYAGLSVVNNRSESGIVPVVESDSTGATGIAVINTEDETANVTFKARDSEGTVVAEKTLTLQGKAKYVDNVVNLFSEYSTDSVTHLTYSSDREVVVFGINFDSSFVMGDAIPGI